MKSEEVRKDAMREMRRHARKHVRRDARKTAGEDRCYIYISPGRHWFTYLQHALQHAQNDKLWNRMAADMKAIQTDSFDHTSNINAQFTSNYEDYMHLGEHPITQGVQT